MGGLIFYHNIFSSQLNFPICRWIEIHKFGLGLTVGGQDQGAGHMLNGAMVCYAQSPKPLQGPISKSNPKFKSTGNFSDTLKGNIFTEMSGQVYFLTYRKNAWHWYPVLVAHCDLL